MEYAIRDYSIHITMDENIEGLPKMIIIWPSMKSDNPFKWVYTKTETLERHKKPKLTKQEKSKT